jgi:CMP/dCMP kinase
VSRPIIVAIDGPAGAGKSTVSKLIARRLNFALVDTGAIYRCVALAARGRGVALDDDLALERLLPELHISFSVQGDQNHVYLDGQDVSLSIRTPENSMAASKVSARPVVRSHLLELQRRLALESKRGAILEGRDIGTVVFPDADLKFFLDADPAVRARRRYEEIFQKGDTKSLEAVKAEQEKRDKEDSEREMAPLKAADDAVRLDSTQLPISEVVRRIEEAVLALMPRGG